jgi:hypothetical protein
MKLADAAKLNRKSGVAKWRDGIEAGLFGIKYFAVGAGSGSTSERRALQLIFAPGKIGPKPKQTQALMLHEATRS